MESKVYKTGPIKVLTPAEIDKRMADVLSLSADEIRAVRLNGDDASYRALVDRYLAKRSKAAEHELRL